MSNDWTIVDMPASVESIGKDALAMLGLDQETFQLKYQLEKRGKEYMVWLLAPNGDIVTGNHGGYGFQTTPRAAMVSMVMFLARESDKVYDWARVARNRIANPER
jgi:hypothetical protein